MTSHAGAEVLRVEYARDAVGRVGTRTETRAGQQPERRCYEYDAVGRLAKVWDGYDAGVSGCVGSVVEEYRYDATGNRIYARNGAGVVDGDTGTEVTVDAQDRVVEYGSLQVTYTAAGEVDVVTDTATNEVTDHEYDALGNLVVVADGLAVEYVLDAIRGVLAIREQRCACFSGSLG